MPSVGGVPCVNNPRDESVFTRGELLSVGIGEDGNTDDWIDVDWAADLFDATTLFLKAQDLAER